MSPFLNSLLLGVSLAAPLGPVGIEVIKRGLKEGFISAFIVAFGSVFGDLTCLLLTYFGLIHLLSYPAVPILIWILGSIILFYLGIQSIRDFFRPFDTSKLEGESKQKGFLRSFILGYLLALANPMSIIWWGGVFGASLTEQAGEGLSLPGLVSNYPILLGVTIWFLCLCAFLDFGKRLFKPDKLRYISGLAGLSLIGFACHFSLKAIQAIIPYLSA